MRQKKIFFYEGKQMSYSKWREISKFMKFGRKSIFKGVGNHKSVYVFIYLFFINLPSIISERKKNEEICSTTITRICRPPQLLRKTLVRTAILFGILIIKSIGQITFYNDLYLMFMIRLWQFYWCLQDGKIPFLQRCKTIGSTTSQPD